MTEKRFTLIDMNNIEKELLSPIKDNESDCLTWFEVVECLNALHEEKEDWKTNCISQVNENSILWNEISIMGEQGAKPSSAFKKYCNKFKGDME